MNKISEKLQKNHPLIFFFFTLLEKNRKIKTQTSSILASINISNGKDAEDAIPDILKAIAEKLLQILHIIDSLKLPDIIKSALKK